MSIESVERTVESVERALQLVSLVREDPALLKRFQGASGSLAEQRQIAADVGYGDVTVEQLRQAVAISGGPDNLSDDELAEISLPDRPHKIPCFITTACVEARSLPDDCLELETIRAFRNRYLATRPDGAEALAEYYAIAPHIVAAIEQDPRKQEVYEDLYRRLVGRSVELICSGRDAAAYANYVAIVQELKEQYLP